MNRGKSSAGLQRPPVRHALAEPASAHLRSHIWASACVDNAGGWIVVSKVRVVSQHNHVSNSAWTFSRFCVMVEGWHRNLFSRANDRECCLGSYLDMRARSAKEANIFRLCSCRRSGLLLFAEVLFPFKYGSDLRDFPSSMANQI